MPQQKPPWVLLCTLIASGGLTAIAQAFAAAWPAGAALITNIVAIVVAIAGFVYTYYQAVNVPAVAVAVDPKTGNVPVAHADGTLTGQSVVTTNSTLPTTAPSVAPLVPADVFVPPAAPPQGAL